MVSGAPDGCGVRFNIPCPTSLPLTILSDGGVARSAGVGFDFPEHYHIYKTAHLKKGNHIGLPLFFLPVRPELVEG